MKLRQFLLLMFSCVVLGCHNKQQIEDVHSDDKEELIESISHVVMFQLDVEADVDAVQLELKKLAEIPEVFDLEVGSKIDLGDERALTDYDLMMSMEFKNADAYRRYQAHPIHLDLKRWLKPYLNAPPAVLDFSDN